jgi:hypothetical protein
MTKRIFKFPAPITGRFDLSLPANVSILSVAMQHETPCIWAIVDDQEARWNRSFAWFGTGQPIPEESDERLAFIGTVLIENGSLVFHLFEVND